MLTFLFALALLAVMLLALALRKTYVALSVRELKRRAREQDPIAQVLYRAAAYGTSLRALLWVIVILSAAGSFVLLSRVAPAPLAFIAEALVIAYGFVWMPSGQVTEMGVRTAVWLTPAIAWLLGKLHPVFDRMVTFVRRHRPLHVHTGLYDREDLLQLIEQQKGQADSRIPPETLELLTHALQFGDKLVRDCMVPRRAVKLVNAHDNIGPMLMKDLHDSGFSRFPVYEDKEDNVTGTLYLRKLISLKHTGKVRDIADDRTYFVHEEYPLEQVLDAFIKTQHHMFVVVNRFEEFVGIITIEDILEQILGCKIVDEFDQYDDVRAVAAHQARREHEAKQQKGAEVVEDPESEQQEASADEAKVEQSVGPAKESEKPKKSQGKS